MSEPKIVSKKDIKRIIDKAPKVEYYYSEHWRYPHRGDDAKTSVMLKVMLSIEYTSGTLIFIPDKINKCKLQDRNKEP